ncbi:synaptonemal complex protein 1-like [Dorcoceras hygrometricum]|uniref:Synaptonemal complex protein 1-like n=1 Tax=Dorcoceras hygrometricum TaxID=472368 RepID=A0A2Z7CFP5_9LAMI|nr:synaptonemal complex protein 1-like [Dorcoceras hygrometricum]
MASDLLYQLVSFQMVLFIRFHPELVASLNLFPSFTPFPASFLPTALAELVEKKQSTGNTVRPIAPKAKRLEDVSTGAVAFVQPKFKRKRATRRPGVRPTVPTQMTRPPKRKLILLEDYDYEDPKPLPKET